MKTDPFNGKMLDLLESVKSLMESNQPISEELRFRYENTLLKQKKAQLYLKGNQLTDPVARSQAAVGFALENNAVSSVLMSFGSYNDIGPFVSLSGTKMNDTISSDIEILKSNFDYTYCRHACGLCESSCPHNIPVNTIMRFHHYFLGQGREKYAIQKFSELPEPKTDKCFSCEGKCESACPYGVSIQALLMAAHSDLS